MPFLTPDNIRVEHGLEIREKIIPDGTVWNKVYKNKNIGDKFKAERLLVPKKVATHNTTDIDEAKGTNDAEQYARATYPNQNMGGVIPHYYIDETACWQLLKENEVGYHAGSKGNEEAISIEIIMSGKGDDADVKAEERGALLAAILLNRHGLGIDDLVTHNYYMGLPEKIVPGADKNCPFYILPHWAKFKAKVAEHLKKIQTVDDVTLSSIKKKFADMKNLLTEIDEALESLGNNFHSNKEDDVVAEPQITLSEGDRVKLNPDAVVYGTKSRFADFVYDSTLYVRELSGDRAVISINPIGEITGAVDVKYLSKE